MNTLNSMLELSTAHIRPETCERLAKGDFDWLVSYRKTNPMNHGEVFGAFVLMSDTDLSEGSSETEDIPEDLLKVLRYAKSLGADWVMFDRDAEILSEDILPTYTSMWSAKEEQKPIHVRNAVEDLTKEELSMTLETEPGRKRMVPESMTLGEFINEFLFSENCTITELMNELDTFGLAWPFRKLHVTIEVTRSRGYEVAVLDDASVAAYAKGEFNLEDLDPKFVLDELAADADESWYSCVDYAVEDDEGRKLYDWDD